jgi:DNA-binding NtrC family response regulator
MADSDSRTPRVLIADDDASVRRAVRQSLTVMGLDVTEAANGVLAIGELSAPFDVVITDLNMPEADGFAVLDATRRQQPGTPVVVLTAATSMTECVRTMRAGAFDFVSKPFEVEVLQSTVRAALAARRPDARAARESPERSATEHAFLGRGPASRAMLEMVERVAVTNATVLITGETGTGKELIARTLHRLSPRRDGPLVVVNCGAIPQALIESEFFGHVAGAFTGAVGNRRGRMREAEGGTLFLDEIGELPLELQPRLLRALQERRVTPIGGEASGLLDVRFVAATNRDVVVMVREGRFREDLYFRLNVVPIEVPPLRARPEDVGALVEHFLARAVCTSGRPLAMSSRAMTVLGMHDWPGNVRELEHVILRAAILDRDGTIDVDDLPEALRTGAAECAARTVDDLAADSVDLNQAVARFEWVLIEDMLRRTGGNRSRAAARLGIGRSTLIDKIKRHG